MSRRLLPLFLLLFATHTYAQTAKRSIALAPTAIDFGSVAVGSTAARPVQITNNGRFSVKISSVTASASSFVVGAPAMPQYLAAGASLTFNITFAPAANGPASGSVAVASNAVNSPAVIALSGTGASAVPPLAITTNTLPDGTAQVAYSVALAASGGQPPYTWSMTGGALPPGLALQATGTIAGTPSTSGTYSMSFAVRDALGSSTTKQLSILVGAGATSPAGYGNAGDPYEGGSPGSAVMLAACQILMPNTSYRLSNHVSAVTATDVCFQVTGANTTLDLNGYKVTGRIVGNAVNINGVHIFNGSVECARDGALGGNVGCIFLYGDYYQPTTQLRIHHLNLFNSAACGRALHVSWDTTAAWTGGQYLVRLHNITSRAASGPTCARTYNLSVFAGPGITTEASNNDLTCPADAGACQGLVFYGNDHSRMHDNRVDMLQNVSAETGRAFLCDGGADYCEVDNNLVIANNNRAFRVRDSMHARIHDNTVQQITCCGIAVHLADPDTGSTDLDAIVERNTFEVVDGMVLMIRGGYNAWFRNNSLTCAGCTSGATLARVRTMGTTNITFENNPTATALGSPQIYLETSTAATVCNSGQAAGAGAITYSTACQTQ